MSLRYLICATEAAADAYAAERGWEKLAVLRYAVARGDEVRGACRISQLLPLAGKTPMLRGPDYEDGPPEEHRLDWWIREKAAFDKFVSDGHGEWVAEK